MCRCWEMTRDNPSITAWRAQGEELIAVQKQKGCLAGANTWDWIWGFIQFTTSLQGGNQEDKYSWLHSSPSFMSSTGAPHSSKPTWSQRPIEAVDVVSSGEKPSAQSRPEKHGVSGAQSKIPSTEGYRLRSVPREVISELFYFWSHY